MIAFYVRKGQVHAVTDDPETPEVAFRHPHDAAIFLLQWALRQVGR